MYARITHGRADSKEAELIASLDSKMSSVQTELDALNREMKEALEVVNTVKDKIRAVKPKLVPLAEMRAGVANINSRNKYFPEFLGRFDNAEKKAEFIEYVESNLKA